MRLQFSCGRFQACWGNFRAIEAERGLTEGFRLSLTIRCHAPLAEVWGEGRMKSAIAIVAFSQHSELEGAIALLETAQEALDRTGRHLPAAIVDLALTYLVDEATEMGSTPILAVSSYE